MQTNSLDKIPANVTVYFCTADCDFDHTSLLAHRDPEFQFELIEEHVITVTCSSHRLDQLTREMCEAMPGKVWETVRLSMMPAGQQPTVKQFLNSSNLHQLRRQIDSNWIEELMRDNQFLTFFQPIVSNGNPHNVFAYECLIRGKDEDGELISPARLFSAARSAGLTGRLDHIARCNSIKESCRLGNDVCIFINFNPRFICSSLKSLRETMRLVTDTGLDPSRFVFEVVESDDFEDIGKLHDIVKYCRDFGCRVALDDVGAGYNSLKTLWQVHPDFVKLDMDLAQNVTRDLYRSRVATKLLELCRELGSQSIVEGIENIETWQWAIENGADYSQGFFFAKPSPDPAPISSFSYLSQNT